MLTEAGGPYVQMAVLCERVLQERDGVASIIRVVDRLTVSASGVEPPVDMPATQVNFPAVIMLKSGFMKGRFNVRIVPTTPSGKTLPEMSVGVLLEGDDRGVNMFLQLGLLAQEEGLYWFDVFFEQQLLTRIPLRLVYQRLSQGPRGEIQ